MKYPRTYHLPKSEGLTSDDKRLKLNPFKGKGVVITEKMDGENTVLTNKYIHARSPGGYDNDWQSFMKRVWAEKCFLIPDDITIFGENMYATHSIKYQKLSSYFYVFGVLENDTFLSWRDTKQVSKDLNFDLVPVIYEGIYKDIDIPESKFGNTCEGYVCRLLESFNITDFKNSIAKYVRKNHVQTDVHWTKTWKKAKIKI